MFVHDAEYTNVAQEEGLGDFGCGVEETAEAEAVGPDKEKFEDGGDETGDNSGRIEEEVEEEDVDDDGGKDGEAEGNVAADEQEQASDDLEQGDDGEVVVCSHDAEEGSGVPGRRGHMQEVEDSVEAEDEEHEAEEDAGYENSDLQRLFSMGIVGLG
jgi:hypothetical protein